LPAEGFFPSSEESSPLISKQMQSSSYKK